MSQTFTLDANQVPAVISFKWSFLTSEVSFGDFLLDDFFQAKLSKNSNIETVFLKGSVPGGGQFPSGFPDVGILDEHPWMVLGGESFVDGKTGFQSSNYLINEPGEYTLEFLVADQADVDTNSGLIIDNVTLTTLVNPGLQGVGPISGANGFPIWYEDSNGLRLEPCLSGPNGFDPNCALLADPGFNPSQPIVFPTNFPEEMFYWSADGSMDIGADTGSAGRARLVLAMEGAFTNGPVAVGEQAVFGRVRIVMDAPAAGIYTVTHPYGVDVFNVTEPGPRAVFYTQDHGCFGLADYPCNFAIPLSSRIGPFLTSVDNPPPPAGYIGDGDTPSNVTGSPFNTNFFRIDGPAGVDLDPVLPGVQTTITTNLFILTGRLFSGSANITGLKVNDNNSNGVLDTGEGFVPGWKITVSNDTRGFIANTITDSSGLYRLLNIPNGTYNVSEEVIAGWENTTPISNVITVANTESAVVNFTNRFLADHGVSMVVDESSTSSRLTQPNINATYIITVTNIGHFPDTFDLTIQNPQGAAAALDIPVITLAPGMSGTVLLNVTSGGQGNFNVNVTATSQTDANATTTLGTTTRVTGLQAVGPVDTSNGFPEWYLDTKGLPLEPCLAGPDGLADTNCALLADQGFNISEPIVFPTNFPEEMFYWSADGSMDIGADTGSAGRARLVLAMEGAFTNGPVAVNEQAVFGRVRIVMDAPEAGIYTVTHPYGVDVFNVTEPGPRAVFYTQDHGCFGLADSLCNFAIPLSSRIGPFLTSVDDPPPPAGYIGDGATPSNVTGSPFNTNFFRIDGPAGVDLDPVLPGVQTTITTNLFVLTGKILQDAANITGFKINDSNNNGISDQGESGVAGWNISVKNPVTGQVNNTITDANGFYQFLNLVPGNYIVTEEANASWMNSNATSKTINLNGIDSINNNFTNFLITHGLEFVVNRGPSATLTTSVNINATYVLMVNNTGNVEDTFNLTVTNEQNAAAALSVPSVTLGGGVNGTVLLNVTNGSTGTFVVNVTAASQADPNINTTISTTTEVIPSIINITVSPPTITMVAGSTHTFTATARDQNSDPISGINITWSSSNQTVGSVSPLNVLTDSNGNASTTFTALLAGIAFVNATNGSIEDNAIVTVDPALIAPLITTQPLSQTVTEGQTATFSVVASGTAPLAYQWQRDGITISGATSSTYTTPAAALTDNGANFSVNVSNAVGNVLSSNATLTVNPAPVAPIITTQPISQVVTEGQTATFSVIATGTAPLAYQWQKNGVAIPGATSSIYTTSATTLADNGTNFSVNISNAVGSVISNNAALTVTASVNLVKNPGFESGTASWLFFTNGIGTFSIVSPGYAETKAAKIALVSTGTNMQLYQTGVTLNANTRYRLSFAAYSSSGHDMVVRLFKQVSPYTRYAPDFRPNLGTSWQTFTTEFNTTGFSGTVNDGRLMFYFVGFATAGDIYYIDDVRLEKVAIAPALPTIITHPADQNVIAGQTATFSVVATGTFLSYQWQKNGTNIPGATGVSYTTPPTALSDNGSIFRVIVSNSAGSVTSNPATLTVTSSSTPPGITTQPSSRTVNAGLVATFSVVAAGSAPLTYQWRKNGAAIPGATDSTYTTPATTLADNGANFSVNVSNAFGSVTSNNATLTVTASVNLVKNPGFESGKTSWLFFTGGTGSFAAVSPGFEGNNSARVILNSGSTNIQLYQTGIILEPNTRYRLSFAAYSNTGRDLVVRLFKQISPYTNYGLDYTANLNTGWQTFTTEFTTKGFTGTVNDGRFLFWFAKFGVAGDTYRIDSVRLEKI